VPDVGAPARTRTCKGAGGRVRGASPGTARRQEQKRVPAFEGQAADDRWSTAEESTRPATEAKVRLATFESSPENPRRCLTNIFLLFHEDGTNFVSSNKSIVLFFC